MSDPHRPSIRHQSSAVATATTKSGAVEEHTH
ncbi:hypothetical protein E9229_003843 [Paeniglutamicibacter cryotolerans]|uniref:Uncharacterized protein n=1 Tax=Paeniglutamicibacter cryotolerans TaxID=670079 RepID=A0A839R011_9MICC|nr:hypothetical protein [Paeniglutamicibacter cryotolerans]